MKKFIILFICIISIFSLCSCNKSINQEELDNFFSDMPSISSIEYFPARAIWYTTQSVDLEFIDILLNSSFYIQDKENKLGKKAASGLWPPKIDFYNEKGKTIYRMVYKHNYTADTINIEFIKYPDTDKEEIKKYKVINSDLINYLNTLKDNKDNLEK